MKVSIISESPADVAIIRILAEAVIRRPLQLVESPSLIGGWAAVIAAIPTQYKKLHYNTDAEGLIIMIDSDDSPIHDASHLVKPVNGCRVCMIDQALQIAKAGLRSRQNFTQVRVAIAFPIPAVEAWLLSGKTPHATEAPFIRNLKAGQRRSDIRKRLKQEVYGNDRPASFLLKQVGCSEALRISADLERLRQQFPLGFGSFYETLASWR